MTPFILTKDDLMRARRYVPLGEKSDFADRNAPLCFDRLQITSENEALPPMYMENIVLKNRYLMFALVTLYLGMAAETEMRDGEQSDLMTEDCYDHFAGSHLVAQIKRFGRDKDENVKNASYELLEDYFELARMFSAQVSGLLAVQNDTVLRQSMAMRDSLKELPGLIKELDRLKGDKKVEGKVD